MFGWNISFYNCFVCKLKNFQKMSGLSLSPLSLSLSLLCSLRRKGEGFLVDVTSEGAEGATGWLGSSYLQTDLPHSEGSGFISAQGWLWSQQVQACPTLHVRGHNLLWPGSGGERNKDGGRITRAQWEWVSGVVRCSVCGVVCMVVVARSC